MAGSISSLTHNTFLKENVWYAYDSLYVFNYSNDPSLNKLTPSVGDNFYLVQGTSSTTSTTYTFSSYDLWGTILSISNHGNRIVCKRSSDNEEYTFVRIKHTGNLIAWYSSSDNQRVYTQTIAPVPLEGFYDENGIVYTGYTIGVGGQTPVSISSVANDKIVLCGHGEPWGGHDIPTPVEPVTP